MSDGHKLLLLGVKQKAWNKTREKYMLVTRRQIEIDRGSYYNKGDCWKYFQMVKMHYSMVMKVMIVIMTMRIIMNSNNEQQQLS